MSLSMGPVCHRIVFDGNDTCLTTIDHAPTYPRGVVRQVGEVPGIEIGDLISRQEEAGLVQSTVVESCTAEPIPAPTTATVGMDWAERSNLMSTDAASVKVVVA